MLISIYQRLTEASSAAGLASIIGGVKVLVGGDTLTGIGMICAGIAAILVPEKRR